MQSQLGHLQHQQAILVITLVAVAVDRIKVHLALDLVALEAVALVDMASKMDLLEVQTQVAVAGVQALIFLVLFYIAQAVQVVQVLSLFDIQAHNEAQAELLCQVADIPITPSQQVAHTPHKDKKHGTFCKIIRWGCATSDCC
jgi:hypothetical protein